MRSASMKVQACGLLALLLFAATATVSAVDIREKGQPKKEGKIYHGVMFRHYDLDGDGRIEEWRRGEWRHLDTNRDGIPDVFIKATGGGAYMQGWDSNRDGIYDMAQDFTADGEPETAFEYVIEITSPAAAIRRDGLVRVEIVPAREVRQ